MILATLPPALWAVAYVVAKPATATFPPLFLAAICYAVTAVALFRPGTPLSTPLAAIIAAATLGASIQSALIFSGIARVDATVATLVVQSQVPFAILGAWFFAKQPVDWRRTLGSIVALGGIIFMIGLPSLDGQTIGVLLIVSGTFSWGMGQGVIAAWGRDTGPRLMGALSAIAAPQLLVLSLFSERGQLSALTSSSLSDWGAVVMLSLGGFVIAYSIWYGLLKRCPVEQIAPFILLMPIVGIIAAFLLLGEVPGWSVFLGGAVIIMGIAVVVATSTARSATTSNANGRDKVVER